MGSLHNPQNSRTIGFDWTGFQPHHRKSRVQRPPTRTHWPGHPFRMFALKVCVWEPFSHKTDKGRGIQRSWVEQSHLPSLEHLNTKVTGALNPVWMWLISHVGGAPYLGDDSPTLFPYLRPGNGERIKWKMRKKGKNLDEVHNKDIFSKPVLSFQSDFVGRGDGSNLSAA